MAYLRDTQSSSSSGDCWTIDCESAVSFFDHSNRHEVTNSASAHGSARRILLRQPTTIVVAHPTRDVTWRKTRKLAFFSCVWTWKKTQRRVDNVINGVLVAGTRGDVQSSSSSSNHSVGNTALFGRTNATRMKEKRARALAPLSVAVAHVVFVIFFGDDRAVQR